LKSILRMEIKEGVSRVVRTGRKKVRDEKSSGCG
jgi:hypothetical protein